MDGGYDSPGDAVALDNRAGAEGENLRTIKELEQVLDEDEDAKGGKEKYKIRSLVLA